MRITSSKRDEILKERDEYQAQWEANKQQINKEREEFYQAEDAVFAPIREYVEQGLSQYNLLEIEVRVERGDWFGDDRGAKVRVGCNQHQKHFDKDSALSWDFEVKLDKEGNVRKETGSWSGLQATTPAQLKSLRQSVWAIEWLNEIDWKEVLDKETPKYEDYFKTRQMQDRDPEFNRRLREADLEDCVGKDILVKVQNFESSGYWGQSVYVQIIRETPAQWVVKIMPARGVESNSKDEIRKIVEDRSYTQRVKKANLVPIVDKSTQSIITFEF